MSVLASLVSCEDQNHIAFYHDPEVLRNSTFTKAETEQELRGDVQGCEAIGRLDSSSYRGITAGSKITSHNAATAPFMSLKTTVS